MHVPLVEAQVSVYTPWQIVLVDTPTSRPRVDTPWQLRCLRVRFSQIAWCGLARTQQPRKGPTWPRSLGIGHGHARAPRGPDFGPRQPPRESPTWPRFWASSTATRGPHVAKILGLVFFGLVHDFGSRQRSREGPTWPRFWASSTATQGPHVAQILGLVNSHARSPRGPDLGPCQQPRKGPTDILPAAAACPTGPFSPGGRQSREEMDLPGSYKENNSPCPTIPCQS